MGERRKDIRFGDSSGRDRGVWGDGCPSLVLWGCSQCYRLLKNMGLFYRYMDVKGGNKVSEKF
jgi:hypothetical protein